MQATFDALAASPTPLPPGCTLVVSGDGRYGCGAAVQTILRIAATGYALKFLIALGLTPVIYAGRWFLHDRFGLQPLPAEARS